MHMQAPAVTPLEHPDIIRISFPSEMHKRQMVLHYP
jgi:hypothetical protein